jgi:hypothetical protein
MIRAVVANGRYFDRATLDQLLAETQVKRGVGCEAAAKVQLKVPPTARFRWGRISPNRDTTEPYPYKVDWQVTFEDSAGTVKTRRFACYHNGRQDFRGKIVLSR